MQVNTDKALVDWLQVYHASVGKPADECVQLYHVLRNGKLATDGHLPALQELLEVMSGLSPDPRTVSCAMLLVASECGEDITPVRADLSRAVLDQFDQFATYVTGSVKNTYPELLVMMFHCAYTAFRFETCEWT